MDETGFRMGVGRNQKVIVETGTSRQGLRLADPDNRESITSVECVNCAGASIPPLIVLAGKQILESMINNDLDEDIIITLSETGYVNDVIVYQWLQHFEIYSRKHLKGIYRMLIMDGYGSHLTIEFVDYCDKNKIIPFCLPAHLTHLLQPLDVVIFQPYKHYHAEAIDQAVRLSDAEFNKAEFLAAFQSFRAKAFKKSTLQSSFRKTGLIPYNPEVVLAPLRAKKTVEDEHESAEQAKSNEQLKEWWKKTPSPPSSPIFQTPHTVGAINKLADHLGQELNYSLLPTNLEHNIRAFLKGSTAKAMAGQLAEDDLAAVKNRHNSKVAREKNGRRVIESGLTGLVSVKNARAMKKKRLDDEIRKANAVLEKEVQRRKKLAAKVIKIALVGYRRWQKRWKADKIWLAEDFYGKFTYETAPEYWSLPSDHPEIVRGKYNASPYRYEIPYSWRGTWQRWRELSFEEMDEYNAKIAADVFSMRSLLSSSPIRQ